MIVKDRACFTPTVSDEVRLNAWLDQRLEESRIESSLAADLKLCVNEIFANLMSYGLKDVANPFLAIEIELRPGYASAVVTDNGMYFDLRDWSLPEPRDLMTGELGGFGILLIKERASSIDYARTNGMNRLTITCEGAARN